tara:strand:+ start:486 stop:740 length:255 start_codon:yes stop_codon:yes gene_type:complete
MNYLSKENKEKYLPRHTVRNVHNAIMPDTKYFGSWIIDFSYMKLLNDWEIELFGGDPNRVYQSSVEFTRKADALKFVRLVNKGA